MIEAWRPNFLGKVHYFIWPIELLRGHWGWWDLVRIFGRDSMGEGHHFTINWFDRSVIAKSTRVTLWNSTRHGWGISTCTRGRWGWKCWGWCAMDWLGCFWKWLEMRHCGVCCEGCWGWNDCWFGDWTGEKWRIRSTGVFQSTLRNPTKHFGWNRAR